MGQLPTSRKTLRQRQTVCHTRRKGGTSRAPHMTLSRVSCKMVPQHPLPAKLLLPLTPSVTNSRTLPDRRFGSATRYATRRHDKAAIKKGLRVPMQTPPEHKPKRRGQPLPQLVWAQSHKDANRIVHALNGNVDMRSSPKARTASRRWAAAGSPGDKHYQNVCLIDSLRSLGVKLQYTADGPFWALSDGNAMISSCSRLTRRQTLPERLSHRFAAQSWGEAAVHCRRTVLGIVRWQCDDLLVRESSPPGRQEGPLQDRQVHHLRQWPFHGCRGVSGRYVPVSVMPQAHNHGSLCRTV